MDDASDLTDAATTSSTSTDPSSRVPTRTRFRLQRKNQPSSTTHPLTESSKSRATTIRELDAALSVKADPKSKTVSALADALTSSGMVKTMEVTNAIIDLLKEAACYTKTNGIPELSLDVIAGNVSLLAAVINNGHWKVEPEVRAHFLEQQDKLKKFQSASYENVDNTVANIVRYRSVDVEAVNDKTRNDYEIACGDDGPFGIESLYESSPAGKEAVIITKRLIKWKNMADKRLLQLVGHVLYLIDEKGSARPVDLALLQTITDSINNPARGARPRTFLDDLYLAKGVSIVEAGAGALYTLLASTAPPNMTQVAKAKQELLSDAIGTKTGMSLIEAVTCYKKSYAKYAAATADERGTMADATIALATTIEQANANNHWDGGGALLDRIRDMTHLGGKCAPHATLAEAYPKLYDIVTDASNDPYKYQASKDHSDKAKGKSSKPSVKTNATDIEPRKPKWNSMEWPTERPFWQDAYDLLINGMTNKRAVDVLKRRHPDIVSLAWKGQNVIDYTKITSVRPDDIQKMSHEERAAFLVFVEMMPDGVRKAWKKANNNHKTTNVSTKAAGVEEQPNEEDQEEEPKKGMAAAAEESQDHQPAALTKEDFREGIREGIMAEVREGIVQGFRAALKDDR